MIKGVVLSDCYGNQVGISEDWIKAHGTRRNSMFWAICPTQEYKEGDYVDLAFFPFANATENPDTGEWEFLPIPEYIDDRNVSIGRHFYHNGTFESGWKSDRQKDIDIKDIEWADIEMLKIKKLL